MRVPSPQFGRYLLIGVANTAFGYSTFAVSVALLNARFPGAYMVAALISSIVNVTFSFLGYKWFVFRTRGDYIREWLRCLSVYGGIITLGLALLPVAVFLVEKVTHEKTAPYIAGALVMGVQVVLSFLGHKKFSFRNPDRASA